MRKIICIMALLGLATPLFAADPFVGTWKLDPSKTKYTTGTPAKDVTLVIEEQGDSYQVIASGSYQDGSPVSVKYTVPKPGGAGTVQEGAFDAVSSKRVSARVRDNRYSKNGKEILSRRVVVSQDGKTMRITVKGTDAQGKPIAGVDIFDKQ